MEQLTRQREQLPGEGDAYYPDLVISIPWKIKTATALFHVPKAVSSNCARNRVNLKGPAEMPVDIQP
jgi:hypothetical protein